MRLLCSGPDRQVWTLRYVGETSDKKPMRLIGAPPEHIQTALICAAVVPLRGS
jgi:hypothetical protein